jgi:hypothetical protein
MDSLWFYSFYTRHKGRVMVIYGQDPDLDPFQDVRIRILNNELLVQLFLF